jgi:large subunit ribosomal protein L7/L12
MGIFGTPQDQVDLDDLKLRVTRLETAVAALQAQAAVPYGAPQAAPAAPAASATAAGTPVGDPAWLAEVRSLKAQGNLITAIKVYRENTGVGLKEAKDAVEALY